MHPDESANTRQEHEEEVLLTASKLMEELKRHHSERAISQTFVYMRMKFLQSMPRIG